ncbi:MAG: hypothetical protein ACUVTL_02440 [Thermoproteota archaeon]
MLKNRDGLSSIAIAALLSIVVMLVYLVIMNSPGGSEKLFIMIFDLLKFLGIDYDPMGVVDSSFGQVVVYFGSLIGMVLLVIITFVGTKITLEFVTTILAWRKRE